MNLTEGQIKSWYHGKIPRIQHGKRIYEKRYLTDEEVIRLFTGTVLIQEKVDGTPSATLLSDDQWLLEENISGKHTVHKHVIRYRTPQKRIPLDVVADMGSGVFHIQPYQHFMLNILDIATLKLEEPTIEIIHGVLEALSRQPSRFGSPAIEGLVIKNYVYQSMGKWVNEQFEDKLNST